MDNPQKVMQLLETVGAKNRDLLDFMGKNWNGSLQQVINGDIRVSKLEKIADFFGVPVDTFFDRGLVCPSVHIGGVKTHVHNFNVGENCDALRALLSEKDKRIQVLEQLVDALQAQISIKTNSDKSRTE